MKKFRYLLVWTVWLTPIFTGNTSAQETSARGPAVPSVASPITVACLGASITYGFALSHPETQAYPQQLQRLLGPQYEVTNYGVSGATLLRKGELSYWNTPAYQAALRSHPDIVTIDLGGNDSKLINRIHLDEFLKDGADLVRSFYADGRHPRIIILLPFPCFLKDTSDICDRVIVGDIIPLLQLLARDYHLEVLDMHTPFADKESWIPDKIHPDERGAALTARLLYRLLLKAGSASPDPPSIPPPTYFARDFAPSQRPTDPAERPFRDDTCLNGYWKFLPVALGPAPDRQQLEDPVPPVHPVWPATRIRIPSPWNVNSFPGKPAADGGDFITYPDYPAGWDTVRAGWLMRQIPYKHSWRGHRLILHFEAVAGFTRIFVNGVSVGSHFDNFLPFDIDVTDRLHPADDNELLVWVASSRLFDEKSLYGRRTYVGGSFWGQHIAGIWQDVDLLVRPTAYVSETIVRSQVSRDSLCLVVTLRNTSSLVLPVSLSGTVHPWINEAGAGVTIAPEPKGRLGLSALTIDGPTLTLLPHADTTVTFSTAVRGRLSLWDPEHPALYSLLVRLTPAPSGPTHSAAVSPSPDIAYTRFGWREASIRDRQFLLNGRPLILKGDSWHFMGIPQMTRRYAWAWYTLLKAANANAVRLHAEPYPAFYLDMADEMGVLVLDETAMWASDGGPNIASEEYWKRADEHLKDLIIRDRNHPSVFGWSVCNENIPVAVNVFHAPEQLVQRQLAAIDHWVAIARAMDPTRDWISGDGETGRPTDLPTLIGHYGGEAAYKEWSSGDRLWGIGESGMAYYGTPRQTAAFNGNASYSSQWGRMEGVAAEAIRLVNLQKKYKAVYRSVFNLVWYGLQPLELGLPDTTRAPMPGDGIFFPPFKEGQPGVQPQRLGPYTSTLNPGYDPRLPLYRPWPLLTALTAAFADSAGQPEPPAAAATTPLPDAVVASAHSAVRLLSSDPNNTLDTLLRNLGVDFSAQSDHIIIDGIHPPDPGILTATLARAETGASVFIWGIRPSTAGGINAGLPAKITVTVCKATSFIPRSHEGLADDAAWYFSEASRRPVSNYGLTGDFVQQGKVLLTACNTDWQRWNGRPEYSKTAAVLRSEREAKAAGNVLVEYTEGRGKIDLLSIDPDVLYKVSKPMVQQLLLRWGAKLADSAAFPGNAQSRDGNPAIHDRNAAIDAKGLLRQAILYKAGHSVDSGYSTGTGHSADSGRLVESFDFAAPARLGFWLYSPRSLVNLLVEPDLPTLNMTIRGSNEWRLWINGNPAGRSSQPEALPLQKGWNHLVLEVHNRSDQSFTLQLTSNIPAFLSTLRSAAAAPDTESIPNDNAHE